MIIKNRIDAKAYVSPSVVVKGRGTLVVGSYAVVEENVIIDTGSNAESVLIIGNRAKVKTGSVLRTYGGQMSIGSRTTIGEFNVLASHGGLTIGRECMFGPYVFVNAASHIIDGDDAFRYQGETALGVSIGDGAWLGARCSVLDDVSIGARCVVGAHSLVLNSLPADHVAFGQPATVYKRIQRN